MFKFLFILLFISTPAFASDWTAADTKREAVYLTLHFIDYKQTLAIPDRCKIFGGSCRELNPILGKYPHEDKVAAYFVGAAVLQYTIARALPAEYRKAFQYISIGCGLGFVAHNFSIGIKAKF